MGWGEFWARYAHLKERQAQASSEDRWAAALNRGGAGMRQRGVIH